MADNIGKVMIHTIHCFRKINLEIIVKPKTSNKIKKKNNISKSAIIQLQNIIEIIKLQNLNINK